MDQNVNRVPILCAQTGAGAAFGVSNTANVTSAAPLVLKFTGDTGISDNAVLRQLELTFTVLANATTTISVSFWRAYAASKLSKPLIGYNVTGTSQVATPVYNASTAAEVIADGGGCNFSLFVDTPVHPNSTKAARSGSAPDKTQDLYILIKSDQAGTSTLSAALLTVTP